MVDYTKAKKTLEKLLSGTNNIYYADDYITHEEEKAIKKDYINFLQNPMTYGKSYLDELHEMTIKPEDNLFTQYLAQESKYIVNSWVEENKDLINSPDYMKILELVNMIVAPYYVAGKMIGNKTDNLLKKELAMVELGTINAWAQKNESLVKNEAVFEKVYSMVNDIKKLYYCAGKALGMEEQRKSQYFKDAA